MLEARRKQASVATDTLSEENLGLLDQDAKVALVATVSSAGLPHLTLITSLRAKTPTRLIFGQFCEGTSKANVAKDPQVGFLALDKNRLWCHGKARWLKAEHHGEDYEAYNRRPMFRYNAYFGIHTVHYLDLVEVSDRRRLSASRLAAGLVCARGLALATRGRRDVPRAVGGWSRVLIGRSSALKFLCCVGSDGYPIIVPGVATALAGGGRVVVVPTQGAEELGRFRRGCVTALFALDTELRSVLLRGSFSGWRRSLGIHHGGIEIDWIYNSMPPKHGQIYPPVPPRGECAIA